MNDQDGTSPVPTIAGNSSAIAMTHEMLRAALPASQPQEGSPANTFTDSELQELQAALPGLNLRPREQHADHKDCSADGFRSSASKNNNVLDICAPWEAPDTNTAASASTNLIAPSSEVLPLSTHTCAASPQEAPTTAFAADSVVAASPQEAPTTTTTTDSVVASVPQLDWHGAPSFDPLIVQSPRDFRDMVRQGKFTGPTNAVCPGFLQCNLVVLPAGPYAFDFLLFCQRNPKACPLLEVCDTGSPVPLSLAPTADLRTDIPKYAIYRDGKLVEEVTDVTAHWPENSVAFLIGCSFSYDGALMDAGIPLRSAEQGKNVPMYKTNLKCRPAGSLHGNVVVSMKPISALQISKEIEITSKFPHAHGGPICVGCPEAIGISSSAELMKPDWGDAIELQPHEVPVFHACGVTPQSVLMDSKVPFAITHAAGHMFVTDRPSDMGGGL